MYDRHNKEQGELYTVCGNNVAPNTHCTPLAEKNSNLNQVYEPQKGSSQQLCRKVTVTTVLLITFATK